jgi:hypothetical protein
MKQPLPAQMIPALDSLQSVWFKMADEEQRVESVIRDTPDPSFDGGEPDPAREEMIRVHGIVRAHRRFTRQCIDLISWGDPHEKLPHFSDKAKVESAETAQKAAETFGTAIETAADDCITALYNLGYADEDNGRDVTEENVRAIARNLRYALDSAKATRRESTR